MAKINPSPTVSISRNQNVQQQSSLAAVSTYPRSPSVQSSKLALGETQKGGQKNFANGNGADGSPRMLGESPSANEGSATASKQFKVKHGGSALLKMKKSAKYLTKKGTLGVLALICMFCKTVNMGERLVNRIVKKKAFTPAVPKPQKKFQKRLVSPSPEVKQITIPSKHSQKLTLQDVWDLPVVLRDWKEVVFGWDIASLPEEMRERYQRQGRNIIKNKTIDKIASRPAELTTKVWDSLAVLGVRGSTYADFFRIYSSQSGKISEKTANKIAVCMLIGIKQEIEEFRYREVSPGNTEVSPGNIDELLDYELRRIEKAISDWDAASIPATPQPQEKQRNRLIPLSPEVKQIIITYGPQHGLEHSQEVTLQDLNSLLIVSTDWKKAVFGVDTNSLPEDMKKFHQKQGRSILRNKTIDKIASRPARISDEVYVSLKKSQKVLDSPEVSKGREMTYADLFNIYSRESGEISEETVNKIAVDMLIGIKQDIEKFKEKFNGEGHYGNTDKPLTDTNKSLVDEILTRSLRHIKRTIEHWRFSDKGSSGRH